MDGVVPLEEQARRRRRDQLPRERAVSGHRLRAAKLDLFASAFKEAQLCTCMELCACMPLGHVATYTIDLCKYTLGLPVALTCAIVTHICGGLTCG